VASHLDEIPTNSKGVVVLHWYLHLGRASHNIYRQHIQNAKQSIKRLTERSPNIKIFIKGPHSVQYWYHIEPHDYAALVLSILLVHDKEYHLLLYIYPVGIVSCHVSFGGLSKQDIIFSNNLSVSEKEI
jgi:hypothetical protein